MPIPTKIHSAKPSQGGKTSGESSSLKQTRTRSAQEHSNDDGKSKSDISSGDLVPTAAVSRSLPRPTTTLTLRSLGHARTTSTIASTSINPKTNTVAPHEPVEFSGVTRLSRHGRQQSASVTTQNGSVARHSRTVSTSTTSSGLGKPAASRLKSAPPISKPQLSSKKPVVDASGASLAKVSGSLEATPNAQSSRLREELLQLQLVHKQAAFNLGQYENSARTNLIHEADEVRQLQDQVQGLEATQNEVVNSIALHDWLQTRHSPSADQQIASLSHTITELDRLFRDSAALRLLDEFEHWLAESLMINEERSMAPTSSGEIKFVRPLGQQWSQQMHNLLRTTQVHRSTMMEFGEATKESGISLVLSRYRRLVNTLLEEIETALVVERMTGQIEASWEQTEIEKVTREIPGADTTDGGQSHQHVPAWM